MQLSVVVPCHNEAENIPLVLERFRAMHAKQSFELVLVNNASIDNSATILKESVHKPEYQFVRVVEEPVPGYGRAIIAGLRAASGDVLAWTHADLQTDPADVIRAFELFKGQPDPDRVLIKGKRVKRSLGQWAFTFGMSIIASVVLKGCYFDINAQPKMFSRSFFKREFRDPPGDFSLDLYLLAIARRRGYPTVTFPVFFKKRLYGQSKWAFSFRSKWKAIARTVCTIFALRHKTTS